MPRTTKTTKASTTTAKKPTKKPVANKPAPKKPKAKKKVKDNRPRCRECMNQIDPENFAGDTCKPCIAVIAEENRKAEEKELQKTRKWFVLAVGIECDEKVKNAIDRERIIQNLENHVTQVVIPRKMEKVLNEETGRMETVPMDIFQGYLLVEMSPTEDAITLVQGVRGAIGLLPLKPSLKGFRYPRKEPKQSRAPGKWEMDKNVSWQPTAVESKEAALVLIRNKEVVTEMLTHKPPPKVHELGSTVTVTNGPFKNLEGQVTSVDVEDEDNPIYIVTVQIIGRPVPVELQHNQVQ